MGKVAYEYDVAISFLAQDESLALRIRDLLSPLRVFVFSKAQESLAGEEGVGAFREVFRNKARVSLVLFRARWGQTKWTRVEETAIRDHCLEAGWDHLMFVKLEKAETPTWVPESYLYLDYQAFGISDLIGAVKAKCAKLGVELKAPTAADRAARDAAKEKLDAETEQMLRGSAQPLYDAAESVFDALERLLSDIEQRTGWTIVRGKGQPYGYPTYVAFTEPVSLQLSTRWGYGLGGGEPALVFQLFHGRLLTPAEQRKGFSPMREPQRIRTEKFRPIRAAADLWCWQHRDQTQSAEQVAELVADEFREARQRARRHPEALDI